MEARKIQSKKRYILAFLIGTFIFILGFAITYSISYMEYRRISSTQDELSYNIFQDKLKNSLFEGNLCNSSYLNKISEDLWYQGTIIGDIENKLGKTNNNVLFRKKFYTLMELEHYEFVRKMNTECNFDIPTIFFFYSNEGEDIEQSENLGNLLTSVSNRNPGLIIYSFDINLNSDLVTLLKVKYEVDKPFTLIINGKIKVLNPRNIEEIEKYLK